MKNIRRPSTWKPGKEGAWQGLPFDTYLNAPGKNKSRLLLADESCGGCPAKYKRGMDDRDTPAMSFGRAVHAFALEGKREWAVSPFDSFRTNEAKEWRAAQTVPVVTQAEENEIIETAKALRSHTLAWPIIKGGRREVSMFADYGGHFIKCRPDIITPTNLVDIKTTADASTHAFARTLHRYGYDIQAALCWKAAVLLGFGELDYCLVAIERGNPPLFNVRRISSETMQAAQARLDMLLLKVRECEESGVWPDYSGTELGEIDAPAWTRPDEIEIEGAMEA